MNYKYTRISRKKNWQGDLTETTFIEAYERFYYRPHLLNYMYGLELFTSIMKKDGKTTILRFIHFIYSFKI